MRRNWAVRILVILASASLVIGGLSLMSAGKPFWSGSVLPGEISTPSQLSDQTRYILVSGIDSSSGAALAEMSALIDLDLETGRVAVMYIPGDTLVGENAVRYGRLSGTFNWGTEAVPEGGAAALAECVSSSFVIPVDNYLIFDMALLPELTERLGGVRVTLPESIVLEDGSELEEGDHIFRVDDVCRYVIPDDSPDPASSEAIRAGFMEGVIRAVLGMPAKEALSLAKDNRNAIDTDISIRDHLNISGKVFGKSGEQIDYFTLPGTAVSGYGSDRLTVWSVRRAEAAALMNDRLRAHTDHILAEDISVPEIPA